MIATMNYETLADDLELAANFITQTHRDQFRTDEQHKYYFDLAARLREYAGAIREKAIDAQP